ncbi:MAG: phage tail protein I [Alcaligenaceae bacterium]|nr:phage tail protein I [Alcaligenaceae bacterium]
MSTDILPPSSSRTERALAAAAALPVEGLDASVIGDLWNPHKCPAHLLPWLAWAFSVDMWDDAWTESRKREIVAGSLAWHRKKGTPWALRQALAAVGYPVVNLIEYRTYYQEWIEAGGRTLDGSWTLGEDIHLDPPAGAHADIRRMALSHWAEYAIKINTVDSPWGRDAQRLIRSTAQEYAPARSRLRSIIITGAASFDSRIQLTEVRQRGRIRFDKCKRTPVHRWRTLDGCWTLSAGYTPRRLNGAWDLAGDIRLTGEQPTGPALDSAFSTINTKTRSVFPVQGGGGDRLSDPGLLVTPARLDGSRTLDGRKTSGHWKTDGTWSLDYPTLSTIGLRRLDGTWNLGRTEGRPGVWFTGIATTRRGGVVTREVI